MGHPQRSAGGAGFLRDQHATAHCAVDACSKDMASMKSLVHIASHCGLGCSRTPGAHVICAVAMVHIEVEHHDPLQTMPLLGILRSNGDRVEQAEAHRTLTQAHSSKAEAVFHAEAELMHPAEAAQCMRCCPIGTTAETKYPSVADDC